MSHQRDHRHNGEVELGFSEATEAHLTKPVAHAPPPKWLVNWEAKRPLWLTEMIAEACGVFAYVYLGVAATATFTVTTAAKLSGFGSLLQIGFAYGLGISFAILIAAPLSGGHLSPGYTIAFACFKGFPVRKVPQYLIAQLFGAFIACLVVYGSFGPNLQLIAAGMKKGGLEAEIFSPNGPAGVLALFPNAGQGLGHAFMNEFFVNVFLAIVVFTVLDISNAFVTPSTAPLLIGAAYACAIWGFAAESLALNTARDLGGRIVGAIFFGSKCFTASPSYTALAALTNILASVVGGLFHTLFLSDSARLEAAALVAAAEQAQTQRVLTGERGTRDISQSHLPEKADQHSD